MPILIPKTYTSYHTEILNHLTDSTWMGLSLCHHTKEVEVEEAIIVKIPDDSNQSCIEKNY